jgi:hypothetical protein
VESVPLFVSETVTTERDWLNSGVAEIMLFAWAGVKSGLCGAITHRSPAKAIITIPATVAKAISNSFKFSPNHIFHYLWFMSAEASAPLRSFHPRPAAEFARLKSPGLLVDGPVS